MLRSRAHTPIAILAATVASQPIASAPAAVAQGMEPCCAFVELRQYTLRPGQRDVLIELFDREFVETQEATGMTIIGQFRDLDRPDYFVWLRGFPDMPTRATALAAFYGGPAWRAHREKANGTMIDSDNVLLLEPALPRMGFVPPARATEPADTGLAVATLYYPRRDALADFPGFFSQNVHPLLTSSGATIVAAYVTSPAPNNFPALPVREETAFVSFAVFESEDAYERHHASLMSGAEWKSRVAPALNARLAKPTETLRLEPTSRSRMRYEAMIDARVSAQRIAP